LLPQQVEAVLFDAGGTLVTLDYPFIADTLRRHGSSLEADQLPRAEGQARLALDRSLRLDGPGDSDASRRPGYFWALLEAAGLDGASLARGVAELERAHAAHSLWRLARDDAPATLRGLRARGLRTAVVSNADGRIQAMLAALGLAEHLDLVVDSHLEGVEKPDPAIFQRTLERLGVGAGRCVYVGDIYTIDAMGARAAGLEPVILDPTGAYGPLDCTVIGRLSELLTALGKDA
jgi:HAD superfamily hydrolase (TIGR01549 family)